LLQEQTLDLRTLDLAGFRRWLDRHLDRWRNDPAFLQRARIRDLRRAHPRLRYLEKEHRHAVEADAASAPFSRLRQLEWELINTNKAIVGLSNVLGQTPAEKRQSLQQKLDSFQARNQTLREEQARLIQTSPQRQTLLRISAELQQFRTSIGLDCEEAILKRLLQRHGHRSVQVGSSFEKLALTLTRSLIVPDLLPGEHREETRQCWRILQRVTLGAARTEFDQMVVRVPDSSSEPVEVLAVVEVKRNLNDLANGFRQRQENLAWLLGVTEKYDPQLYRTRWFTSGHFDRPAVHQQQGESFVVARGSFRHFQPDPESGLILDRLYFITRTGSLWGVSAGTLARITFRIATDEDWQPESDSYLDGLLRWCRSLAEPIETPDVLRLYTTPAERGKQILIVDR